MFLAGTGGYKQGITMMRSMNDDGIWVAVRVQRGFVSDICAFDDEKAACRRESSWRRCMNPDYDETAVSHVHVRRSTHRGVSKNLKKRA
jgi:hypothetical protein